MSKKEAKVDDSKKLKRYLSEEEKEDLRRYEIEELMGVRKSTYYKKNGRVRQR